MAVPAYDSTKLKISDQSRPDFEIATPSDTEALLMASGHYPVALYVGTGGNVVLVNRSGSLITFKNVPDGYPLKGIYPIGLMATNTTATDIIKIG